MRAPMSTPPAEPRVPEPWPPPDEGDLPDPGPTPAPGEPAPGPISRPAAAPADAADPRLEHLQTGGSVLPGRALWYTTSRSRTCLRVGAGTLARSANLVLVSTPRRTTSLMAALGIAVLVAVPAASGQSLYDRKSQIDSRISALRGKISGAKEKEGVLSHRDREREPGHRLARGRHRLDLLRGSKGSRPSSSACVTAWRCSSAATSTRRAICSG